MVTEREYNRDLNRRGFQLMAKRVTPTVLVLSAIFLYAKHCDLHYRARANFFYNKSKLFGGLKNHQY